ncbi:hypothetical protein ACTWQB_01005 [Piscibacillus sp. B03]|uniref:hypothetical protein n=1 Tax=Piscibacillus sp. B03 TaxID=3457430 RepID=UPI003FCDE1F4
MVDYTFIIIGIIPYMWLYVSYINVKKGKKEKLNKKGPLFLFITICLLILVLAIYQKSKYELPIFMDHSNLIGGLIVSLTIFIIIGLINLGITFRYRKNPLPKNLHDPKAMWIFTTFLAVSMFIFMAWIYPAANKLDYTIALNNAYSELEQVDDEEIGLRLAVSEDRCLRRRNCDFKIYNVFYARNNMDEVKEVQFLIRTVNRDGSTQKEIESKVMRLEPGEIKLVETEETNSTADVWMKYSFTTENWFDGYQFKSRYRDVD